MTNQDHDQADMPSAQDVQKHQEHSHAHSHAHHQKAQVFAPLNIPLSRRLQTLAVLFFELLIPLSLLLCAVCIFFPALWVFFIPYVIYCLVDRTSSEGGRRSNWVRNWTIWKHFAAYFPIRLHQTAELDTTKGPFVFAFHPHGIISMGAFANFGTNATGFDQMFPTLNLRLLTLRTNFFIPFFRDLLLAMGICDASAESCNYVLKKGAGNGIMLVVGGAAEALDARPGYYDLTLAQRKGFVKIALKNGAQLCPVFAFGETEIFDQIENLPGSFVRKAQKWLQKRMGFSIPLISGRGIFNYKFGFLPFRAPINVVIGTPIALPCLESPTREDVDHYHDLYIKGLKQVWDDHKNRFALNRKSTMRLVDAPVDGKTK